MRMGISLTTSWSQDNFSSTCRWWYSSFSKCSKWKTSSSPSGSQYSTALEASFWYFWFYSEHREISLPAKRLLGRTRISAQHWSSIRHYQWLLLQRTHRDHALQSDVLVVKKVNRNLEIHFLRRVSVHHAAGHIEQGSLRRWRVCSRLLLSLDLQIREGKSPKVWQTDIKRVPCFNLGLGLLWCLAELRPQSQKRQENLARNTTNF